MFKAISWGQYVGVLFLLLLAYYAYVGLAYYRVELLGLLKNKGKEPGPDLAPARPRSLTGKGSLIAKTASAVSAATSAASEEGQGEENVAGKESPAATSRQQEQLADEQPTPVVELPPLDLPNAEENKDNNYENYIENDFTNDNLINFAEHNASTPFQGAENGTESVSDNFYLGSTIGIAQLGNYLGRATEGQVTPEQLVEQEPGLANTDLLLAFFQDSTKNAQRATAHLYADVDEPVLN